MSGEGLVLGAVVVYGALAGTSVAFNRYVDRMPLVQRPDGLTALWVGVGVLYSLLGGTVVAALAMGWLLELATRYGAGVTALALLVIYLVAFVASGAPMLWGDLHRSYRTRTVLAALAAAERALEE